MNKTYAQVVSKSTKEETHQMPKKEQTIVVQKTQYAKRAAPQKKKITVRCLHGEICYKGKLCGDCILDEDKQDRYYTYCDNMNFDCEMNLKYNTDE